MRTASGSMIPRFALSFEKISRCDMWYVIVHFVRLIIHIQSISTYADRSYSILKMSLCLRGVTILISHFLASLRFDSTMVRLGLSYGPKAPSMRHFGPPSVLLLALLYSGRVTALSSSSSSRSSSASTMSPNQQALSKAGPFPHTWVPLASVFECDPERPNAVQFLGQDYVTYRGNNGTWVLTDDACPHRLAPLSEGRVDREKGLLECSYHGWAFDSAGNCQRIPQVDAAVEESAKKSGRCNLQSYPVQVEKNVLWAWLWPEDCLTVAGIPEAHPETMVAGVPDNPTTYTRDLPYGWDTLLENLVDPSHVPFVSMK